MSSPSPRPAVPQCVCPVGRVSMKAAKSVPNAALVPPRSLGRLSSVAHLCGPLCLLVCPLAFWSKVFSCGSTVLASAPAPLLCAGCSSRRNHTRLGPALPSSEASSLLSLLHPWCPVSPAWRPPPRGGLSFWVPLAVVMIVGLTFEHMSENNFCMILCFVFSLQLDGKSQGDGLWPSALVVYFTLPSKSTRDSPSA